MWQAAMHGHISSRASEPTHTHECPLGQTGRFWRYHSRSPWHSTKPTGLGEYQSMQFLGVSANVQRPVGCVIERKCSLCSCFLPPTCRQVGGNFSPFPHAVLQSIQKRTLNARTLFLIQGTWNAGCWELERALGRYCTALASCSLQGIHCHSSRKLGTRLDKLLPCPRTTNLFPFSSKIPPWWECRGQILP